MHIEAPEVGCRRKLFFCTTTRSFLVPTSTSTYLTRYWYIR